MTTTKESRGGVAKLVPEVVEHPLGDNPPVARLYYGRDVREVLRELLPGSVQTVCTSPPYW